MNLQNMNDMPDSRRRDYPKVIGPDSSWIFRKRAKRFTTLSSGHPLSDWLAFLCRISESQHRLLQNYPPQTVPDEADLAKARANGMPPLPASSWPRSVMWQQALSGIISDIEPHASPPGRDTLAHLKNLDNAALETLADQILRVELSGPFADFFPYIAAALQVHFTALAATIQESNVLSLDAKGVCPCCGFMPVGSVVRTDGEIPNLRYLHCGLCNTEWHMVRVTCAACQDSGSGIAYRYIDGTDGSVRAETCATCKSYLKIIYLDKSPNADPVADDLATLGLDLLLEETGYDRMSPNLMFAHCA